MFNRFFNSFMDMLVLSCLVGLVAAMFWLYGTLSTFAFGVAYPGYIVFLVIFIGLSFSE